MSEYSRRSILASTGLALGGSALLGSEIDLASTASAADTDAEWPQGLHDARNSGAAPDVNGPTADYLSERWTFHEGQAGLGYYEQPTLVDGTLYAMRYPVQYEWEYPETSPVYAVDADDGSLQWETQLEGRGTEGAAGLPNPVSPAVAEGFVCIPTSGETYGLDADTGEIRWRRDDVRSDSTPVLSGGTVLIPTDGNAVVALDIADGSTDWERSTGRPVSTVATVDDRVVAGGEDGVVAFDTGSDGIEWTFDTPEPVMQVVLGDENVFAVGRKGTMHVLSLATGERQWDAPIQTEPSVSMDWGGSWNSISVDLGVTAPVVVDGMVLVNTPAEEFDESVRRNSVLVARDTSTGDVLWQSDLLGGPSSVAGSHVYAMDYGYGLVVGDLETGELATVYSFKRHHILISTEPEYDGLTHPVVDDGTVYFAMYDAHVGGGSIYAIEPGEDAPQEPMDEQRIAVGSELGRPFTVGEEVTVGRWMGPPNAYNNSFRIPRGYIRVDFDDDGEYEWTQLVDAGGHSAISQLPTWTYEEPGEYDVTVLLRDKYGRTTTSTESITILAEDELPDMGEADISITEQGECSRLLEGSITGEPAGDATYHWRIGDEPIPEFTPDVEESGGRKELSFFDTEHGTYYVRLIVHDNADRTVTTTTSFEI